MSRTPISHPSQLTPESLNALRESLQNACSQFNQSEAPKRPLHIRELTMLIEDGQTCLDLFVEPAPGYSGTTPFPPPSEALSLDECLPLHQYLLNCGAFDDIADDVGIRVGSLGMEPPLRTLVHFESARSHFVVIKTWTKRQGRDRFSGLLDDVKRDVAAPTLLLQSGTEVIEVPLSAVKFAQALLEKPKAAKANAPRPSKRG